MNDVKWTCLYSWNTDEDICKQKELFELVPGPHKFTVTIENNPGETWYYYDLYLKVRNAPQDKYKKTKQNFFEKEKKQ